MKKLKKAAPKKPEKFREIVINACYGGFRLSHEAVLRYAELKGLNLEVEETGLSLMKYTYSLKDGGRPPFQFSQGDIKRDDPHLVKVVKELKDLANTRYSKLKIVKIPFDVKWYIEEYDGHEHVAENHRTWC